MWITNPVNSIADITLHDHDLLDGLGDDDHTDYLINVRHDLLARHTLGVVIPHDALADLTEKEHGSLTDLGVDDHHNQIHVTEHENGGSDELNVGGLNGVLADTHVPLAHKASHQNAGADEIDILGLNNSANKTLTTQGDVLIRGAAALERLAIGVTGLFLKSQGADNNPVWDKAGAAYELGTEQLAAADAVQSDNNLAYTKEKEFRVARNGEVNIQYKIAHSHTGISGYGKVYVNGIAVGVEHENSGNEEIYLTYDDDITVEEGDLLQVYTKVDAGGWIVRIKECRVRALNPEVMTVKIN